MSFIKEWVYRLRHNKGFGVQSPWAFHFVMHVLREGKHTYYCYPQLDETAHKGGEYSAAHCRRLFRISNFVEPRNIITFADTKSIAQASLSAGRIKAPVHPYKSLQELKNNMHSIGTIGLMHIAPTAHYAQAVQVALPPVDNKSTIIVAGIHSNKHIREWWKQIVAHPSVVISMDLYSAGILFFDTKYKKQHYTFWFK